MARRAQLVGEEKLRRQTELLEESRQAAAIAVKGQSQLMTKLNEVQKWTDSIDDDDAVRAMRRIFQRVEDWIKRSYGQEPHTAHSTRYDSRGIASHPLKASYCKIQVMQGFISEQIFDGIFSRFMVGMPDRNLDNLFYQMDKEIQRAGK
ncbi:hypothetical protein F1880_010002 [Penicillium rolfsii]|nr:hypothetical protein F1880_010002 [Penicillium rolfsii]